MELDFNSHKQKIKDQLKQLLSTKDAAQKQELEDLCVNSLKALVQEQTKGLSGTELLEKKRETLNHFFADKPLIDKTVINYFTEITSQNRKDSQEKKQPQPDDPKLLFLTGIIAAGKSTMLRNFEQEYPNMVFLNQDDIFKAHPFFDIMTKVSGSDYTEQNHKVLSSSRVLVLDRLLENNYQVCAEGCSAIAAYLVVADQRNCTAEVHQKLVPPLIAQRQSVNRVVEHQKRREPIRFYPKHEGYEKPETGIIDKHLKLMKYFFKNRKDFSVHLHRRFVDDHTDSVIAHNYKQYMDFYKELTAGSPEKQARHELELSIDPELANQNNFTGWEEGGSSHIGVATPGTHARGLKLDDFLTAAAQALDIQEQLVNSGVSIDVHECCLPNLGITKRDGRQFVFGAPESVIRTMPRGVSTRCR